MSMIGNLLRVKYVELEDYLKNSILLEDLIDKVAAAMISKLAVLVMHPIHTQ